MDKPIRKTISLTMPRDLHRKLERLAEIDRRKVSNYIAKVIMSHIEGKEVK